MHLTFPFLNVSPPILSDQSSPCSTAKEALSLPFPTEAVALKVHKRHSHHGAAETNLTRNHEDAGSIPGLAQWVKDPAMP